MTSQAIISTGYMPGQILYPNDSQASLSHAPL